jgi:hypothetical protein
MESTGNGQLPKKGTGRVVIMLDLVISHKKTARQG